MEPNRRLRARSKKWSRRSVVLWTAVLLPVLAAAIWVAGELWRESINLALIEAIDQDDTGSAVRLLNLGADAKIKDGRRVSGGLLEAFYCFRDQILGRKPSPVQDVFPEPILIKAYQVEDSRTFGHLDSSPLLGALLDHGADASALSFSGATVLHWAVMSDEVKLTRFLLDHHVRADIRDSDGETPLMRASDQCSAILLDYGADVNARDNSGNSVLMHYDGSRHSNPDSLDDVTCVKMLRAHHADINAQNLSGQTALMCILDQDPEWRHGAVATAECLISNGANVLLKDRHGKTALDYVTASMKEGMAHESAVEHLRSLLRQATLRQKRSSVQASRMIRQ